jgi:6,7-dimethyl-8-ribityllumazine synthase
MATIINGEFSGAGLQFAVVASRFNDTIVERLLGGCLDALERHGAKDILIVKVPGAWEIPLVAKRLAVSGKYAGVICLGAVVRGSTPHFDYVCAEVSKGVAHAASDTGIPVIFGVLTTNTFDEAVDRSGGKSGNKGFDAAMGALEMANVQKQLTIHGL